MKKRYIALIALFIFVLGGIAGHLLLKSQQSIFDKYQFSEGNIVFATSGEAILVNDSATIMSDASKDKNLFESVQSGDKVLVVHGLTMTTYPGQSAAYYLIKLPGDGESYEQTLSSLREMGWIE